MHVFIIIVDNLRNLRSSRLRKVLGSIPLRNANLPNWGAPKGSKNNGHGRLWRTLAKYIVSILSIFLFLRQLSQTPKVFLLRRAQPIFQLFAS